MREIKELEANVLLEFSQSHLQITENFSILAKYYSRILSMTENRKLLYILPECAYAVELLPAKKPNSFTVHTFRQINGNFLNDNEFIKENVEKLVKKFNNESYELVLPDFLFTNTIIDVQSTNESDVQKHLKDKVLPELQLSEDNYYLKTFTLTQHQQKSKVQLSALEKSVLQPLTDAAKEQNLHFEAVLPLSWTVKAAISLEPSLSTIQMGERLYVAQHYIGVDQAIDFAIADTKNIVETIKTLRGAEPNIQTMYLFTNELVENELKEHLSGTLPLQQLGNQVEAHDQMPAYVRFTVETAAKTLSIPDFHVPSFSPEQAAVKTEEQPPAIAAVDDQTDSSPTSSKNDTTVDDKEAMKKDAPIPAPTLPPSKAGDDTDKSKKSKDDAPPAATAAAAAVVSATTEITPIEPVTPVVAAASAMPVVKPPEPPASITDKAKSELPEPPHVDAESKPAAAVVDITEKILPTTGTESTASKDTEEDTKSPVVAPAVVAPVVAAPVSASVAPEVTASPVSAAPITPTDAGVSPAKEPMTVTSPSVASSTATSVGKSPRPVLKKKNDAGDLLKVVFATVAALVVTVAIGVGVGFGLLKLNQKQPVAQTAASPTPEPDATIEPTVVATPTATSSGTASGSATLERAGLKILVVNATNTAGKAGKTKSTLTSAGYKTVDTGNAKGTYEEAGTYILLSKSAAAGLQTQLATDLKITLTPGDQLDTEDPKGTYDAVIVLNE